MSKSDTTNICSHNTRTKIIQFPEPNQIFLKPEVKYKNKEQNSDYQSKIRKEDFRENKITHMNIWTSGRHDLVVGILYGVSLFGFDFIQDGVQQVVPEISI